MHWLVPLVSWPAYENLAPASILLDEKGAHLWLSMFQLPKEEKDVHSPRTNMNNEVLF